MLPPNAIKKRGANNIKRRDNIRIFHREIKMFFFNLSHFVRIKKTGFSI